MSIEVTRRVNLIRKQPNGFKLSKTCIVGHANSKLLTNSNDMASLYNTDLSNNIAPFHTMNSAMHSVSWAHGISYFCAPIQTPFSIDHFKNQLKGSPEEERSCQLEHLPETLPYAQENVNLLSMGTFLAFLYAYEYTN